MSDPSTRKKKARSGSTRLLLPMVIALVVVAGFQVFWVNEIYRKEAGMLEARTTTLFLDMMRDLQDSVLANRLGSGRNDSLAILPVQPSTLPVAAYGKSKSPDTSSKTKTTLRFHRGNDSAATRGVINILRIAAFRDSTGRRTDTAFFTGGTDGSGNLNREGDSILKSIDPNMIESISINKRRDTSTLNGGSVAGPHDAVIRIMMKDNVPATRLKPRPAPPVNPGQKSITSITLNNDDGQRVVIRLDSVLSDKLPYTLIRSSFLAVLNSEGLQVPFTVTETMRDTGKTSTGGFPGRAGLYQPYEVKLGNTVPYLLRQVSGPIFFSLFLVSLTVFAFVILYRSLLKQYRLSQMKNDLVSNITHELKTPIATVGVAIEALRNFSAINDPGKTEEYLEISSQELQRLGLLVDKVLQLSMFENEQVNLAKEPLDLHVLVKEVTMSLRLQLEKQQAKIEVVSTGNLQLCGDRLHLLSVIFNLLDNALKYAGGLPRIKIIADGDDSHVTLVIADNGIGIPPAYRAKVFDKFFRVPHGDTHNAKGHGLGLSYAAEVVRQHGGSIVLDNPPAGGCVFTISLPKN